MVAHRDEAAVGRAPGAGPRMVVYDLLGKMPWPKDFAGRLTVVCFLGTHIPLIVLVVGLAAWVGLHETSSQIALVLAFGGTVVATAVVLAVLRAALVPIERTRQALDAFFVARSLPSLPTDYDDEIGRLMAHTQTALEGLAGTLTDLDSLAHTDSLTGIGNRRWLAREAEKLLTVDGAGASLILFRIDDFKRVNDQHGHFVGDNALRELARFVVATVEEGCLVARLAGAEFCVLLPTTALACSIAVAESLRTGIAERGFGSLPPGAITVSVGVARVNGCEFSRALARVDLLACKATADGGNRLVVEGGA